MRSIVRLGLSVVLATLLAAPAAWALEYDDIFELTLKNVPDVTIVQMIVDDGRAFELGDEEILDLRGAGVSEVVIDAMLDPEVGRAWLAGETAEDGTSGGDTGNGYTSSLDEAYAAGVTPLVFSFGYYYGPLARYYYDDPYYYPFWSAGYAGSYWPSYFAYGWRPADDEYYAYPYNWYEYSSYYCHTYYEPEYWIDQGYTVLPGSGPTVWDRGPRFRGGGIIPPKGGRPDAVPGSRLATSSAGRLRNPAAPLAIAEAGGKPGGRVARPAGLASSTATTRTASTDVAEQRARMKASRSVEQTRMLRERRSQELADEGAEWARRASEENAAMALRESERWARQWQERMNSEPVQAPPEAPRSREVAASAPPPPPPPPAERVPVRVEQPRVTQQPATGGRGDAAGDDGGATRSGRNGR